MTRSKTRKFSTVTKPKRASGLMGSAGQLVEARKARDPKPGACAAEILFCLLPWHVNTPGCLAVGG